MSKFLSSSSVVSSFLLNLNVVISTAVWEDVFLSFLLFPVSNCTCDPYERRDCVILVHNFIVFKITILEVLGALKFYELSSSVRVVAEGMAG